MRELKGNWKDLFNGFMLALDLRKMFLGFAGIMFSLFGPFAATAWTANEIAPDSVQRPESFALNEIWATIRQSLIVIYEGVPGSPASWTIWVPHLFAMLISLIAIWSFFGGAIARIAAYEIAKDGERIETARALQFAKKKFWAFFMSPWICVIGFVFFLMCNVLGGAVGRLLDFALIGGPIVALLLPLALLSGFIMTLIALGTIGGSPLFTPAVAAEGTDAFDAVSRGFSYVYSRPWHFVFYQFVAKMYGVVCISFVILFAVLMCHIGIKAGAMGFDAFLVQEAPRQPTAPLDAKNPQAMETYKKELEEFIKDQRVHPEKYAVRHDRFQHIADAAWAMVLTDKYAHHKGKWCDPRTTYHCLMKTSYDIVKPDMSMHHTNFESQGHVVAAWIVLCWLVGALGLALGYIPSYCISQQTLIYFLLRKKVDGIEMNEVFEEIEEDAGATPEPSAQEKKPEPPSEEKKS